MDDIGTVERLCLILSGAIWMMFVIMNWKLRRELSRKYKMETLAKTFTWCVVFTVGVGMIWAFDELIGWLWGLI